jgi:hypothetical protein
MMQFGIVSQDKRQISRDDEARGFILTFADVSSLMLLCC